MIYLSTASLPINNTHSQTSSIFAIRKYSLEFSAHLTYVHKHKFINSTLLSSFSGYNLISYIVSDFGTVLYYIIVFKFVDYIRRQHCATWYTYIVAILNKTMIIILLEYLILRFCFNFDVHIFFVSIR